MPSAVAQSNVITPAGAGSEDEIVKVNVVAPLLPSLAVTSLIDKIAVGACINVVAVALLSLKFASVVVELTEAVFEAVVPAGPFAVATSVTVKDAPLASEASETV